MWSRKKSSDIGVTAVYPRTSSVSPRSLLKAPGGASAHDGGVVRRRRPPVVLLQPLCGTPASADWNIAICGATPSLMTPSM